MKVAVASLENFRARRRYRVGGDGPQAACIGKETHGAEISARFDGATMKFASYAHQNFVTGMAIFDLQEPYADGELGGSCSEQEGEVKGFVEVKGDQWCFKPDPKNEFCNFVYQDGADIYEVSSGHVVVAKERKKAIEAPERT